MEFTLDVAVVNFLHLPFSLMDSTSWLEGSSYSARSQTAVIHLAYHRPISNIKMGTEHYQSMQGFIKTSQSYMIGKMRVGLKEVFCPSIMNLVHL